MRFTDSRLLTSALALALAACEGGAAPAPGHGGGDDTRDAGALECTRPGEGCPCEAGSEPLECYPDPVATPGGGHACLGVGLRFCRDRTWTACDVGSRDRRGAPGVAVEPLLVGPTQCNPCDPRCFGYSDQPTSPGDVGPDNSSGVVLRPGGTGVELPQSGVYMGTGDMDADGVPDDFDTYPDDPARDGFTDEGGIFHMLPENTTAGPDPITISTTITSADVYVLMDATGSMAGEISNLRSSLTTGNYLGSATYPTVAVTGNEAMGSAHNLGTDPQPGTYTRTGNTSTMNNDHTGAGCTNNSSSRDAVFRFTLTTQQTVTISTAGSGYDTSISLRNASFGEIVCNDDANGTYQSAITRTLNAGTYYVLLEGYGAASGPYVMTFTFASATCAGVLGAINCIIPNAQFGVGWFREYSISPHGVSTNPVYRHVLDITNDFGAVQTAVNGIVTEGNADWPESLTQALYSAVTANGLGSYYPSRAANSSFGNCAASRWGYPCFRTGAIPIVIGFTDAPVHEGPDHQFDYTFDQRWPSVSNTSVSGNDRQSNAYSMGDITTLVSSSNRRIYAGSTYSMTDDYGTSIVGCNGNNRDSVFSFTLSARRRVQLTTYTTNSSYDTVLSLFRGSITAANRVACSDDIYFSGSHGMITTTLDAGTYYVVVDGNGGRGDYYLSINGRTQTDGSPPYPSAQAPAYWQYTAHALAAQNVKFIGIRSCSESAGGEEGQFCADTLEDLRDIGLATDSVDDSGTPFVYTISNDGSGLSDTVVNAVQRLANFSRMDISARATDNPATAFDERNFIQSITISNCSASRCTGPRSGAFCGQCLPGTDVGFDVVFRNSGVAPTGVARTAVPQTFDFELELVGDGSYVLDSVPVRIVVPPIRAEYPATGTYWRDFDSTERCAINERPDWGTLDWTATTPGSTSITLQLRAADSVAGLDTATPANVVIPPATPTRDIATLLRAAGYPDGRRYLRVTAVLSSGPARDSTPNLSRLAVNYTCLPAE